MTPWRRETPLATLDPLVGLFEQHVTAAGRSYDTLTRAHAVLGEEDIPDSIARSIVLRMLDEALLVERRGLRQAQVASAGSAKRPVAVKPQQPTPTAWRWTFVAFVLTGYTLLAVLFAVMLHLLTGIPGMLAWVVTEVVGVIGLSVLLAAIARMTTTTAKGGK